MSDWFRFEILVEYAPLFQKGLATTILITLIGVLGGTCLGLVLGVAQLLQNERGTTDWILRLTVRTPAKLYVTFFRGTPLFVQILLVHFALMPQLIHADSGWLISGELARTIKQDYGAFLSGSVALILNAAAYIAEIFRAGIQSLDRGQMEAARSLGFSYLQSLRLIIVPQAFRRMLPPLANEAIMLLKDSSLVSTIGLAEIAYAARTVAGAYARYWEPYLAISLMYLVLTLTMAHFAGLLEKKYGSSDQR